MNIVFLIIGIILGIVVGFLLGKNKSKESESTENEELDLLKQELQNIEKEKVVLEDRIKKSIEVFNTQKQDLEAERFKVENLTANLAKAEQKVENAEKRLLENKKELEELQQKFSKEFELIANRLLKQNSSELAENNQKRLSEILNPLKEKIQQFEQKVEDKYEKELKERSTLLEQINQLKDLNLQMSEEASNLTKALKGDNKAQGNWGEFILEKILENSGLREGEEYETQYSTTNEEGKRIQPDVVVKLPENKHIIIDSKVSLIAYENYVNEENEELKEKHLKNHLISLKNHVKQLSEKNYSAGKSLNAPDFVLLFVPIESSFSIAIQADKDLYGYAWEKKVVIVSPSTLLATLRTISSVWKQENQNRNIQKISEQAGALYDKFVGFVEDMKKIEKGIQQSKAAYDNAFNKLSSGSGNLVRRSENIRKLGVATKKILSQDLIEKSEE